MRTLLATLLAGVPLAGLAGEPVVEAVEASRAADGTWRFDVTVRHADEGWDHYADAFVITAPDGTVLGTRTLLHPHVDEQPFTRALTGVVVPDGVGEVRIHARDTVHGDGPAVSYALP